MKEKCPDCGQLIEKRGMHSHVGSKKCKDAQSGKREEGDDTSKCPDCGTDMKILTEKTIIKLPSGQYVEVADIIDAVEKGYTKYCARCLEMVK